MIAVLNPNLPGSIIELPKLIGINNYAINLEENKQTLFGLVYKLGRAKNSKNSY